MRCAIAACVLGACGFSATPGGGVAADGATDDGVDGDAAPPESACTARWIAGPAFTAPVPLAVNTAGDEADPWVSPDERTLYFALGSDVFEASRATAQLPFASAAKDADLSSAFIESKVSMTADGLTAFLSSNRTGSTSGSHDIWRGTRTTPTGTFTFDRNTLAAVDTAANDFDPHISLDGLRLYFAPETGTQHIVVASRAAVTADFGAPVELAALASTVKDNDPTLSSDERVIVYATSRGGNRDLWYATRASATATFGAPQPLPAPVNATTSEDGPHLTADGCTLYFVSDRAGSDDLFVAPLQ